MKILFDGRLFTYCATGVTTYSIDAIKAIDKYLSGWEVYIVAPKPIHKSVEGLPIGEKIKYIVSPMLGIQRMKYKIWYNLYFPFLAKKYNVDMIWSPTPSLPLIFPSNIKTMITIHDVVGIELKKTLGRSFIMRSFDLFSYDINRADYIWCNSHYTENKICQYFPNRKQKDTVVGCGCNERYKKIKISNDKRICIFREYGIKKGFYLFVGTLEPRKNITFLLKLVPRIYAETQCKLLIVGSKGWKNSNIYDLIKSNNVYNEAVHFCDYVSNERLLELYNLALCYVSTSINEGFGIPQLEAMRCGCPVISPHNSAMIEVVGNRGVTIKGWDENVWIDNIIKMLCDKDYATQFKNPNTSEYNWEVIINRVAKYINKYI